MTALSIITIILAVAGLAAIFWRQYLAAIVSYAALVCACVNTLDIPGGITHDALMFWGVATVIVVCLRMLNSESPALTTQAVFYSALGAIAGASVGFVTAPTSTALIVGASIGAVLGSFVYTRTPQGRPLRETPRAFLDYLCAIGLPMVVSVTMSDFSIAVTIPLL